MSTQDPSDDDVTKAEIAQHADSAWAASEQKLQLALSQHLTVAFLGSASAGKDSAIRALFGIDFGDISPIPGSTSRLRVSPLDVAGQVLVVNAPGFGDIRSEVDAIGRRVLDSLDIVIYVVNSEGGATIDEKNDLAAVRATGKPVLVALNKIDLIRPAQRDAFVAATLLQLGVDKKDAIVCAFDPLPQLANEPLGVSEVVSWVYGHLEKSGKDLMFAKSMRNKALACEPIILSAAKVASMAGAVPIPGVDLAAVTAIQVKLIRDLAVVFDIPVDKDLAIFLVGELLSGSMKGFARWGVQALKAAGWIPGAQVAEGAILALGALIAGATTYGVGHAAVRWFQAGRNMSGDELRALFDAAAWKYKERKSS